MEGLAARRAVLTVVAAAAAAVAVAAVVVAAAAADNCTGQCGGISIAYPFGVEPGCYLDGFNLTCDLSRRPPRLLLGDGTMEVLEISIPNGTVRVSTGSIVPAPTPPPPTLAAGSGSRRTWGGGLRGGGPFFVSPVRNKFLVLSCSNVQVLLVGEDGGTVNACSTYCPPVPQKNTSFDYPVLNDCSGISCCSAAIPKGYPSYTIQIQPPGYNVSEFDAESSVYIAEEGFFNATGLLARAAASLPVLLDWVISNSSCPPPPPPPPPASAAAACRSGSSFCQNYTSYAYSGYQCRCSAGYEGNPYIPDGCQDIDECQQAALHSCYGTCTNMPGTFQCRCPDGTYGNPLVESSCIKINNSIQGLTIGLVAGGGTVLVLLAFGVPIVTRKMRQRKVKKRRDFFFRKNHGLLLQQLISQKADISDRMIISLAELESATNKFDRSREVGGGGHGTVYKGIIDLQVVAVKRSRVAVEREIADFVNEVAVLSQINHRNVVRLLGCCLESEVPLLVYEFIPNGTLERHLHAQDPAAPSLPWDDRLRIALEVATALAYLHSAASMPVYHRDVKSSNVLLDDVLTAKVSDFGTSRYVPLDHAGVTTAVQGTIGYLDPMYYYTGRLTDKSDVFSYGVLLVELLTRKRPFVYRTDDGEGLVMHFASLLAGGALDEILDPQVVEEAGGELQEAAALAAACTRLSGDERPAMREVEMKLESLWIERKNAARDATAAGSHGGGGDDDVWSEGDAGEQMKQHPVGEEIMLLERYSSSSTGKRRVSSVG